MRRIGLVVVTATLALAVVPASGHEVKRRDPEDTPGKFDIRWASIDHTSETPRKVILKTKVTGELKKADFEDGNYFAWGLDFDGDNTAIVPAFGSGHDFVLRLETLKSHGGPDSWCLLYNHADELIWKGDVGGLRNHVGKCPVPRSELGGVPDHFRGRSYRNGRMDSTRLGDHV